MHCSAGPYFYVIFAIFKSSQGIRDERNLVLQSRDFYQWKNNTAQIIILENRVGKDIEQIPKIIDMNRIELILSYGIRNSCGRRNLLIKYLKYGYKLGILDSRNQMIRSR